MTRRIVQVTPGVLRIEQRIRVAGRERGTDVSGPACIYAQVRVRRGSLGYQRGPVRVAAPEAFDILLPPHAVVEASLDGCDVTSIALAFRPPDGLDLPAGAMLFAPRNSPRSADDVLERCRAACQGMVIDRDPNPARLAADGKAIIDAEYATPLQLTRLARRLCTSPAAFSRTFKRAYGIPPVVYRHRVRIIDALTRFAEGGVPAEVFQDVGFDDLSRFYKIFRKVACAAPGSYRLPRSRNAKT